MDVENFMRSRGGAARAKDLQAAGFSRYLLGSMVKAGTLRRLGRGIYVVDGLSQQISAAYRVNGVLTCISAARYHRLWTVSEPSKIHLSCGNGVPKPGIVDHAACRHPRHPYLPVAGMADVLLHSVRCLPELEALVMVQSAVSQGLVSVDFLRGKLPGNRNGRGRAVLDLVIPRADSLLEVLARTHFVRAGLRVRLHVDIPGVGEVDCLIDEVLIVELDGSSHFEPRQIKKDQRRNNAGIRGGHLVLRYYYDDVVHHPEAMVAEIKEVLRQRARGRFAP
jgi:very-short-patch-repair endonuclease